MPSQFAAIQGSRLRSPAWPHRLSAALFCLAAVSCSSTTDNTGTNSSDGGNDSTNDQDDTTSAGETAGSDTASSDEDTATDNESGQTDSESTKSEDPDNNTTSDNGQDPDSTTTIDPTDESSTGTDTSETTPGDDDDDVDTNVEPWPTGPLAPSIEPPGGLTREQAPMFVSFGFDDNAYCDSMQWFAELVRDKKNPDGSKVRATFFITAGYADEKLVTEGGQTKDDVLDTWAMLYTDGHEIANHTWSHEHGRGHDLAWWKNEMSRAQDLFAEQLGVPRGKLQGFRTPFLESEATTFDALRELKFGYDCSIEFGYDWWQDNSEAAGGHGPGDAATGGSYYWPYTLDNGVPSGSADTGVGKSPGMWEMPVYTYNQLEGNMVSTITGFDFNMWKKLPDDAKFLEVMKYSFDQRYNGNRSPLTVNAHTDYYSQYNPSDDPEFGCKDYLLRRKAIEDFIDYALSHKEVRIVPYDKVIRWMDKPVAWDKM